MPAEGQIGGQLTSGSLRLSVRWRGDRFQHTINGRLGASLLESTSTEDIATPVYTEALEQDVALFLSGTAGEGPWSASVEPIDGGFLFDVACRVRSVECDLAAVYRVAKPGKLQVIGKPTQGCPAPSFHTNDKQLVVRSPVPAALPATVRLRYAIIEPGAYVLSEGPGVSE